MSPYDEALVAIDSWPVPAAAVAVLTPEGVVARRGAVSAVSRIASVSKLLTAYAVMLAVQEEAVDLDEPAGPPGATLRHLLAHTSGLGFDSGPIGPPGQRRTYSNTGIEAAADHLARRTDIPFGEYLAEAVLEPLGMSTTTLVGSPAHGVHSTVDDLSLFAAELMAPQLLASELLELMTTVQFPGLAGVVPGVGRFDPCDWGLGFERNFGRLDPPHWAGTKVSTSTFGHFGGSGSFLWVDPTRDLACVCLTGRDFDSWAMATWPPLCDAIVTTVP